MGRQVGSLEQRDHQLLLFLLILHSKTQAYSGATGLCPLAWLFRKLVQIWPQAAQWEPASSNIQPETKCKRKGGDRDNEMRIERNRIIKWLTSHIILHSFQSDLLPIVKEPRWLCRCGCCSHCSSSSLPSGTAEWDEVLKLGGRKKGTSAKLWSMRAEFILHSDLRNIVFLFSPPWVAVIRMAESKIRYTPIVATLWCLEHRRAWRNNWVSADESVLSLVLSLLP